MSTFAEKVVDFEITVSSPAKARLALLSGVCADACVGEHEPRAQLPTKPSQNNESPDNLEESFFKLSGQLSTICNFPWAPLHPCLLDWRLIIL